MKKSITLIIALMMLPCSVALADAETPPPAPTPAVVVFAVVPTPTPTPPPVMDVHYSDHSISQDAIDTQAAIFWADCNTDEEKRCYAAVAVNRLVHGFPFGDNLEDILSAKTEWNHGHISDRNREKAEIYLNMAITQYVDGEYAGLNIPSSAVYVKRDSAGCLVLMDVGFAEVYRLN